MPANSTWDLIRHLKGYGFSWHSKLLKIIKCNSNSEYNVNRSRNPEIWDINLFTPFWYTAGFKTQILRKITIASRKSATIAWINLLIIFSVVLWMFFQSLLYYSNSCTSLHFKTLKFHTKALKIRPSMFRSPFKQSSGGPWPYFATLLNWNVDLHLL
jgi:hypothetical protein